MDKLIYLVIKNNKDQILNLEEKKIFRILKIYKQIRKPLFINRFQKLKVFNNIKINIILINFYYNNS